SFPLPPPCPAALVSDPAQSGSVLSAVGVLAAVVAVHEAGHFAAARLQGIRVTRFAIGFGPTLLKYKGPEVEYCLNAIPLGGYVAFPDDDMPPSPPAASSSAATKASASDKAAAVASSSSSSSGGASSSSVKPPAGVTKPPTKPAPPTSSSSSSSKLASFFKSLSSSSSSSSKSVSSSSSPAASSPSPSPSSPSFSSDDPDLLKNRPLGQRALVISAGVAANMVFAYLVLLAQIATVGKAETAFLPGVRVDITTPAAALSASSSFSSLPAGARAGLRSGDVLLAVGDLQLPAGPSQVSDSVAAIRASPPGQEITLTVLRPAPAGGGAEQGVSAAASASADTQPTSSTAAAPPSSSPSLSPSPPPRAAASRQTGDPAAAADSEALLLPGGEVLELRCVPDRGPDGAGRLGVQLSANTVVLHSRPAGVGGLLDMTGGEFARLCGTVWGGLRQLLTNFAATSSQLSGPVAIVASGSQVLRADAAGLFQFAAIVNINLALVNALPLPALDGGYLLLLGLEGLRGGRKLPAALEQGFMASGFLLLTALGLGLVVRDTLNLL
ncbi:hypothetical protein Agub_g2894, partial [Astrephomene gubernaculifera]